MIRFIKCLGLTSSLIVVAFIIIALIQALVNNINNTTGGIIVIILTSLGLTLSFYLDENWFPEKKKGRRK